MGIAVAIGLFLEEQTAGFQVCRDLRIGGFEEFARVWSDGVGELAARFGGEIPELRVMRPSLEEVYLAMVGAGAAATVTSGAMS